MVLIVNGGMHLKINVIDFDLPALKTSIIQMYHAKVL